MTHQRNTTGLRQSAARRSATTRERADAGIQQLLAAKRPVTFRAVRDVSGVSSAWLYRHLKERIMELRAQTAGGRLPAPRTRASEASKAAIITTLRTRVTHLEAENRALRRQLEVAYGQVVQQHADGDQLGSQTQDAAAGELTEERARRA